MFPVLLRLRISLLAIASLSVLWLIPSFTTLNHAFGQTNTIDVQDEGKVLNNSTISYSYNINRAANSNVNLQNGSASYYNNTNGYLVYPATGNTTQNQLPAVIMIHEWWGLNEHIKRQADILAKEGYVVLAVDLYNGQVATDPSQAMALSSSVRNDPTTAIANLESAVKYVKSLDIVNGSRIASLGWCFGGDWSLRLATNSTENPLAATVLYYGKPITDQTALSNIKWPVLGIFGDQDQSIPVDSVKQFASSLNSRGITNEVYLYKGVGHAFANPSGDNYAPKETTDAWEKTLAFLRGQV